MPLCVTMVAFLLNHAPATSYGPLIPRVLDVLKKIKLIGLMSGDAMTQMIAHCMVGVVTSSAVSVVKSSRIDAVGVVRFSKIDAVGWVWPDLVRLDLTWWVWCIHS